MPIFRRKKAIICMLSSDFRFFKELEVMIQPMFFVLTRNRDSIIAKAARLFFQNSKKVIILKQNYLRDYMVVLFVPENTGQSNG